MENAASAVSLDLERAAQISELLKAVAHPLRLRLVAALADGDARVGDLAERLGAAQAIVSQQLRILRMSGLVRLARRGGVPCYQLAEPRLRDLLVCVQGCKRP
jgi:ArsR family transcriptional regulator